MHTITVDYRDDALGGPIDKTGTLVLTAARVRGTGAEVIVPAPLQFALSGSTECANIPETTGQFYYVAKILNAAGEVTVTKRIQLTADADWNDLVIINPNTFVVAPVTMSAQEILEEAAGARDDALESADNASTFADDAQAEALLAEGFAQDAATAAAQAQVDVAGAITAEVTRANAAYAVKSTQTTVEVGRLSEVNLNGTIATQTVGKIDVSRASLAAGQRLRVSTDRRLMEITPVTLGSIATLATTSSLVVDLGSATVAAAGDLFTTPAAHGLIAGVSIVQFAGSSAGSVSNATLYYVKTTPSSTTFTVSASAPFGVPGTTLDVTGSGAVTNIYLQLINDNCYNRAGVSVSIAAATDLFTTAAAHYLAVGEVISLVSSTATGAASDTNYYVKTTPSSTTFTVSATLGGATLNVTADGTATLQFTNRKWLVTETRPVHGGTGTPQWDFIKPDPSIITYAPGVATTTVITAHTMFDGDVFELLLFNAGSGSTRLYVDDVLVDTITSAHLTSAGVTSGNRGYKLVTFPDARSRLITIQSGGDVPLYGIRRQQSRSTARPTPRDITVGPRVLISGDSFTEWTGATSAGFGWTRWVAWHMGWRDVWRAGSGSTGYTSDGTRLALIDRYTNDIIAQAPDVCIIALGLNDSLLTLATVLADAATIYDAVIAGLPACELVVFGPFPNNGGVGVTPALVALDAGLQALAEARSLRFISPIQEGWTFSLSDATHPDNAGHKTIGWRAAGALSVPYLA